MNHPETSIPVTVFPIRDPKPNTWYYGVRCSCARLLAMCEDLFAGKSDDDLLQVPAAFSVQCECGTVNPVLRFHRFKTP